MGLSQAHGMMALSGKGSGYVGLASGHNQDKRKEREGVFFNGWVNTCEMGE